MRDVSAALVTPAGRALGGVFSAVGKARARRSRALHPRGAVRRGVLERHGSGRRTGVTWIDETGRDEVLVRLSRSAGLPRTWPDVLGLAVRIPLRSGGHADLLFSTTGTGSLTRYVLRPARRVGSAYTTMLPYDAPSGPLLLAALPTDDTGSRFELASSSLSGEWAPFGLLEVSGASDEGGDRSLAFDPVVFPIPQLDNYDWVAGLRRYSYAASRRARGAVLR